jgi:hypothetical protein
VKIAGALKSSLHCVGALSSTARPSGFCHTE